MYPVIKDKFINSVYRAVAALMVLLLIGHWQSAFAEPSPGPQELVQNTTGRLLTAIRTEQDVIRQNPERLYELIEDIVIPVVDRERISRWVLGRHWREATPEQRSRFTKEFQTMLIRTYAAPLLDHTDVEVNYLPLKYDPGNTDVVIRTQIQPRGGEPLPVYYSLHSRDGNWKVYDVTIGGVSAVTTLRTTFSSQIRKVGLEEFIRQLSEKNRQRQAIIDITPDFKFENAGH
jgi:phospholipid transport system substrate-binding protein